MSGITGTSSLVLALRVDGERTQFEASQRALEMQNRTDDSAGRTQAAAAEAMESLTRKNAELEARLLAKDQAHSITITGIITGHVAEKTAFEARVVSLEEAVGMRDRMIASLQALIENVKAAIRYLYGAKMEGGFGTRMRMVRTAMRCFIADYITDALEGKSPPSLKKDCRWDHVGIPLRI